MNTAIKKALVAGKHPKGSIQTGQANHTTGSGYIIRAPHVLTI